MAQHDIIMAAAGTGTATYVEDVFSTWLYSGNGSSQTINNGIDLAGKGGMVLSKLRTTSSNYAVYDTVRGATKYWLTEFAQSEFTNAQGVTAFGATGYTVGSDGNVNANNQDAVSWTFRKQPKFFDVVTATATGTSVTFNHALGSAPGFVITRNLDQNETTRCYHQSLGVDWYTRLENNAASINTTGTFANVTSTTFTLNVSSPAGTRFVAYLFAHNAGGFGLTGTDSIISCGTYTGNGTTIGPTVNVGFEPQWLLIKNTTTADTNSYWTFLDTMRGMPSSGNAWSLINTTSAQESYATTGAVAVTATGFYPNITGGYVNAPGATYIYIAIRRPMKVPTDATKVFSPITTYIGSAGQVEATNVNSADLFMSASRAGSALRFIDKVRGFSSNSGVTVPALESSNTGAEYQHGPLIYNVFNNRFLWGPTYPGLSITTPITYLLARATGFFDIQAYIGQVSTPYNVPHSLGVVPELMIIKHRTATPALTGWAVYHKDLGNTQVLFGNTTAAPITNAAYWNNTTPTASVFTVNGNTTVNYDTNEKYVAYLFATCPGVSKVGSYTGTAAAQTINCGFAAGARFVMIKRYDTTGDWYMWDTARGIISGNDPYMLFNVAAADVTTTDYLAPQSVGFGLTATAPAALNASGGTYIFLAIA